MLTEDQLGSTVAGMQQRSIAKNSVTRRIALGITKVAPTGRQGWLVLQYDGDVAVLCDIVVCEPLEDIDEGLSVDAFVLAELETWIRLANDGNAIGAANDRTLVVGGKLPYFIRNVRSIMDIATHFGVEVRAATA